MTKKISLILAACALPILLLMSISLAVNPIFAESTAVFTVTSTADTDDGTCDAHCTLREAIDDANSTAGADTIQFAVPDNSTILLGGTQLPEIEDTLFIDGNTAVSLTIHGSNSSRILEIGTGTAVTLTDLTLSDGFLTSTHPISDGAGIYVHNNAIVTINNTSLRNNYAGTDGGALYNNAGTVILNNTTFRGNHADDDGGAIVNHNGTATIQNSTFYLNSSGDKAGAIYNDEELAVATISNTTVLSNTGEEGGGLRNFLGNLTLYDTSVMYNNASNEGGGLDNYLGKVTIYNSTFAYNNAQDYGGGIYNNGEASGDPTVYNGSTYIQNSTLSHNTTDFGGAISLDEGTVILTNTTIYSNSAATLAGGIEIFSGTIHMTNNIIGGSQSTGGDCVNTGTIATNDNNLIEDNSCTPAISGDPQIGPLSDNGGSTPTHALLDGSPAINAGNNPNCPSTDQRGYLRLISGSGGCDIGAFEITWLIYLPVVFKN